MMLQGFLPAANAIAAIALNALWEDALLVGCVWLLLRSWPHLNAATRYTVWSATLAAAVFVPVATTLPFIAAAHPVVSARVAGERVQNPVPARMLPVRSAPSMNRSVPNTPAFPARFRVALPLPVTVAIFAAWAALALLSLIRLAIGLVGLEQLKRDALPLPVEYRDAMERWTHAQKGSRDVRLCVSDDVDVPVAVGLFDSMILIPRVLLERLSKSEVDQISLHELAHLRRGDDWSNALQRVAIALLAWNPAALFVGQQLDLEREVACDDWVLSLIGVVRPYALCLTKMAETASWPRSPIPAPGVFATRKHISLRIERLLGAGRNIATNLAPAPTAAAIAAVGALALVIAIVAPSIAAVPAILPAAAPPTAMVKRPPLPVLVHAPAVHVQVPERTIRMAATGTEVSAAAAKSAEAAVAAGRSTAQAVIDSVVPKVLKQVSSVRVAQNGRSYSGTNLTGVDWSGRDMRGVSYTGVDLSKSKLVGTNFSNGTFSGVDFSGADVHNASFRNARLIGCDFSRANLTGADFSGAKLAGCQFTGAQLSSAQARDILNTCTGCDFSNAKLAGLDFSKIRASGDDFSRADLRNVNFSGANLTGIDFSRAQLDGANLSGATLNGCDFSGVDLTHVDLSGARLIGTDLPTQPGRP